MPDNSTGLPSTRSIQNFGYVVHLLEDLGAPSHVRNDAHLCVGNDRVNAFLQGVGSCDPFHLINNGVRPAIPSGPPVITTSGFTTPDEFFLSLQSWVSANYYSDHTAFKQGLPGPAKVSEDLRYIYGVSLNGVSLRKIAHKGPLWYATAAACVTEFLPACSVIDTFAGIDTRIAEEQYAELGPVIVQQVAAFTKFYSPALTVQVQGSGSGTVTSTHLVFPDGTSSSGTFNCASGTCAPALFVQGTQITLTATPSTVTWGGDCASAGNSPTATFTLTGEKACTATFDLGSVLVNPTSGQQGQTGLNVAITGQFTHFATGTSAVSFGAGITVGTVTVTDTTHLTAQISIDAAAALGGRTVTVTTGAEVVSLANSFTVAQGGNPAVRLNPFGNQTGTVPYNVEVVNSNGVLTPAPQAITVTLLREVFSECSGLLFSSDRTVVVAQGQSSATFNFDAGHDPSCNTLPITTVYTVTNAVLGPSTVLDLSSIPPQQLKLFSIH